MEFAGIRQRITYNLAGPIQMVDSKSFPGIQIADVFASSIAYSLKYEEDRFARECQELYGDVMHPNNIFPELHYADLSERDAFVNALVLEELVDRTLKGKELFEQIPEFIFLAAKAHQQWLLEQQLSDEGTAKAG